MSDRYKAVLTPYRNEGVADFYWGVEGPGLVEPATLTKGDKGMTKLRAEEFAVVLNDVFGKGFQKGRTLGDEESFDDGRRVGYGEGYDMGWDEAKALYAFSTRI